MCYMSTQSCNRICAMGKCMLNLSASYLLSLKGETDQTGHFYNHIQVNLIVTLYLESIETDCFISETML